ncbi:glycosyltransferase family 2 protein [Liquorilactobacillus hordei]|uniref:glycosyltransferase family 2 protein n=1 Tax=Liquorilactobacillus hordei TaxID=468911 RepID=UPI001CC14E97|nr:glycosyltransferase family 2 protein [Liquorilactobacillus hordei]MBZ2405260.1 hypothetical protein [Liquorilactobacillus hordei]
MNKKLISVIVPCFNAAQTIGACYESIKNQIYKNIEIIFINDGSTDKTQEELIKLKRIDGAIKVISTTNMGVSHARNVGLIHSNGYYITFVDADDVLNKNMYSDLLADFQIYKGIDLVICSLNSKITKGEKKIKSKVISRKNVIEKILYNSNIQGFVTNKIYKSKIISKNNIKFDEKLKILEDLDFNIKYIQYINNAFFDTRKLYNYSITAGGAMFSGFSKGKLFLVDYYSKIRCNNHVKETDCWMMGHFVLFMLILLSNYYKSNLRDEKIERKIISALKENRYYFFKNISKYNKKYILGGIIFYFSSKLFKVIVGGKRDDTKV